MDIETQFSTESKQPSVISERTFITTLVSLPLFSVFFHFLYTLQQFYRANTSGSIEKGGRNSDDGTFATSSITASSNYQDLENALDDAFDDQKMLSDDIDDLAKRIESLEERRKLRLMKSTGEDN